MYVVVGNVLSVQDFSALQGYLPRENTPPPSTLPKAYLES